MMVTKHYFFGKSVNEVQDYGRIELYITEYYYFLLCLITYFVIFFKYSYLKTIK